jgi:hypothetical protein
MHTQGPHPHHGLQTIITTADRRFFFSFLRRGAPEQLFRLVAFFLWYHKSDRSRGIVRIVYMLFGEAMLPLGYASCIYM